MSSLLYKLLRNMVEKNVEISTFKKYSDLLLSNESVFYIYLF